MGNPTQTRPPRQPCPLGRRFAPPALAVAVVAALAGCPPEPLRPVAPPIPRHCPEAPPAMSVAEASAELSRFARETRANLMARLEGPAGAGEVGFATLHPPGLALLEAALAAPEAAQQLEPRWLQRHLLRAYIELHAAKPLDCLEGDVRQVELRDERGQRSAALYMTERSDSQGRTYRFVFDPLVFDAQGERMGVTFSVPLCGAGRRGTATARWRLSQSTLAGMDDLPQLYLMSRARAVRLGRWALLVGEVDEARSVLEEALACAPDLDSARRLLAAIKGLRPAQAAAETVSVQTGKKAEAAELGHDPLQDLALRVALHQRLAPLATVGVVSPEKLRRAEQALRTAATRLSAGDVGWGLPAALTEFDRTLAALLSEALDRGPVAAKPGPAVPTLALNGLPDIPAGKVQAELEHRVLLANYDLVPRWVKGPKGRAPAGQSAWTHLLELRPVVRSEGAKEHVVAKLRRRLGWGWLHPGLPAERYAVRFADHGAEHWRERLAGLPRTLEAHRPLARQLIRREIYGSDAEVAALAMEGLVQLDREAALRELLPLVEGATVDQAAAVLQAVARLPDPRVAAAVARAARSTAPRLRAAAMAALGLRSQLAERELLRSGLSDADPAVARAALRGLLAVGDATGLARARAWLAGADREHRELVLRLAARRPRLAVLARELAALGKAPRPSTLLPAALVQVLGDRAAPHLTRLYNEADAATELRVAVVTAGRIRSLEKLLRKAARAEAVEVRRAATLSLALLSPPPEGPLRQATSDPDRTVRLAGHVGLARLGRAGSLLALGEGARGSCEERAAVIPILARSMDAGSRRRLLEDALKSGCDALLGVAWDLARRYQPQDLELLRAALGHRQRRVRVLGALAVLGLRSDWTSQADAERARP